jgi:cell division protein ZapA
MGRTVELRIAGQSYRVVSSASAEQLEHLAAIVNQKMSEIAPQARVDGAHRLLLVALALAHDAEEERDRREALRRRTHEFLGQILGRMDAVLAEPPLAEPPLAEPPLAEPAGAGEEVVVTSRASSAGSGARGIDEGEERFT